MTAKAKTATKIYIFSKNMNFSGGLIYYLILIFALLRRYFGRIAFVKRFFVVRTWH